MLMMITIMTAVVMVTINIRLIFPLLLSLLLQIVIPKMIVVLGVRNDFYDNNDNIQNDK